MTESEDKPRVLDFTAVPSGTYHVVISEVRPSPTKNGTPRWAIAATIDGGQYDGRHLTWDHLVFSTPGAARARQILTALGVHPETRSPELLVGRKAFVEVRKVVFEVPNGETIARMEAVYDGWTADDRQTALPASTSCSCGSLLDRHSDRCTAAPNETRPPRGSWARRPVENPPGFTS